MLISSRIDVNYRNISANHDAISTACAFAHTAKYYFAVMANISCMSLYLSLSILLCVIDYM